MESGITEFTRWRIEKARKTLTEARVNYEAEMYGICLNRAYYSVFYAMQAANSLDRFDSRKHTGVISYFQRTYMKTNRIDRSLSHIIVDTYRYRERADYEDLYEPTKETAEEQLANAERFVSAVSAFLEPYLKGD